MRALLFCVIALIFSCTSKDQPVEREKVSSTLKTKTLIIIGDSLTEGYGVPKEKAYPLLVETQLSREGFHYKIVNSGISGSTSASAVSRVQWALKSKPDGIVLALGANDGLRGLPPQNMKKNLAAAIRLAQKEKIQVLLFGMLMPPNLGRAYTREYQKVFETLAKEHEVPLLPFLLKDVGGVAKLNQADGVHPNEEGHKIMAQTVFNFLKKELK